MAVDARRPGLGHADRREPSGAVARGGERALERPVRRAVVQRRERGRLAGVVEDARHAGAEVERRPQPLERRGRVAGDEDRVRARGRLAGRRRAAGGPSGVSASVSNGGWSSSTSKPCSRASRASARLAAAVISGPMPWPARQATTYVRRAVIGVVVVGRSGCHGSCSSRSVRPADAPLCGLGRRVRRGWRVSVDLP